jgi:hypothetical protein
MFLFHNAKLSVAALAAGLSPGRRRGAARAERTAVRFEAARFISATSRISRS